MRPGVRNKLTGALGIGVIAALAAGTVASYQQVFTPSVDVVVEAERSGLLLDPGADVTLRGIVVGRVREVRTDGDAVRLAVAVDPQYAERIPADVSASIGTPTLFGPKFVQLDVPGGGAGPAIDEGSVIRTTEHPTEANTLLDNLETVLTRVDVTGLNSALGALSTSLDGRGAELGERLVQFNGYLEELNPSLPDLTRDLRGVADVTGIYADATPDLLATLGNASVTSTTLVEEEPALDHLMASLTTVSRNARDLLDDDGDELVEALDTLRPTTDLLHEYAPMLPCLFATTNEMRKAIEPAIGGNLPGISTHTEVYPAYRGYRYPDDLPKTDGTIGPRCLGGPLRLDPTYATPPRVQLRDGTTVFDGDSDRPRPTTDLLPILLFGDAAREIR